MAHVDMSRPDRVLNPGVDLWEVYDAKEKRSSSQTLMFAMQYQRVGDRSDFLWDNIMLEGRGWGIGKKRLAALGIAPDHKGEIPAAQLMERRVYVATHVTSYNGSDRLSVNADALTHAGYQPESDPPSGAVGTPRDPGSVSDVDGTPF
jgi:hypothetical protein